jgi:hypothetical protein
MELELEPWREAWRKGVVPQVSRRHLEALREALVRDDRALAQGLTVKPPLLASAPDWPPECACPVAFMGWRAEGLESIGAVEEWFAEVCRAADEAMGQSGSLGALLSAVDEWSREEMVSRLLPEVDLALARLA